MYKTDRTEWMEKKKKFARGYHVYRYNDGPSKMRCAAYRNTDDATVYMGSCDSLRRRRGADAVRSWYARRVREERRIRMISVHTHHADRPPIWADARRLRGGACGGACAGPPIYHPPLGERAREPFRRLPSTPPPIRRWRRLEQPPLLRHPSRMFFTLVLYFHFPFSRTGIYIYTYYTY